MHTKALLTRLVVIPDWRLILATRYNLLQHLKRPPSGLATGFDRPATPHKIVANVAITKPCF